MTDRKELEDFCSIFYEITNCPIRLYREEDCISSVPLDPFPFVRHHQSTLWQKPGISYTVSETGLFYARIPIDKTDLSLVIGPFMLNFMSEDLVRQIMSEYVIVSYPAEIVADYLRALPSGIFSKAVSLMRLVVFALTHRLPEINSLFRDVPEDYREDITQKHTAALVQVREEESYHDSYNFEKIVFSRVQEGNVDFFNNAQRTSRYNVGKMAETSLRQEKNMFIVSVTLATRAAMAGGLDEETAFQLSDEYIQAVEKLTALESIDALSMTMLKDFTTRVREASLPLRDVPEDIQRSIKYIRLHTNSSLSVQEVADAVELSRSHFSRKFKEVMGFDVSVFIMRCKLEEAKSLLMYSDQSISEISNYLCFSSQSYFTSVFRNKYGMTPKKYRQQHRQNAIL